MKVLSFIENEEIIRKILKHLGLWVVKTRPPPDTQAAAERTETLIDDSFSQLPVSDKWLYGRGKKPVKIIVDKILIDKILKNCCCSKGVLAGKTCDTSY